MPNFKHLLETEKDETNRRYKVFVRGLYYFNKIDRTNSDFHHWGIRNHKQKVLSVLQWSSTQTCQFTGRMCIEKELA